MGAARCSFKNKLYHKLEFETMKQKKMVRKEDLVISVKS